MKTKFLFLKKAQEFLKNKTNFGPVRNKVMNILEKAYNQLQEISNKSKAVQLKPEDLDSLSKSLNSLSKEVESLKDLAKSKENLLEVFRISDPDLVNGFRGIREDIAAKVLQEAAVNPQIENSFTKLYESLEKFLDSYLKLDSEIHYNLAKNPKYKGMLRAVAGTLPAHAERVKNKILDAIHFGVKGDELKEVAKTLAAAQEVYNQVILELEQSPANEKRYAFLGSEVGGYKLQEILYLLTLLKQKSIRAGDKRTAKEVDNLIQLANGLNRNYWKLNETLFKSYYS